MRRHFAFLLLAACAAAGCQTAAPAPGGAEGARLEAVIEAVRGALVEAQANDVPGFPPLKSVTIKL